MLRKPEWKVTPYIGALIMLLLAACRGTEPCVASAPGVYTLVTIEGQPLPWKDPISTSGHAVMVTAGSLDLRNGPGLSYLLAFSYTETQNGTTTASQSGELGTYVPGNPTMSFTSSGGLPIEHRTGTLNCASTELTINLGATETNPTFWDFRR